MEVIWCKYLVMTTIARHSEFDIRKNVHRYVQASLDYVRIVEHKLTEVLEQMDNSDKN